MQYPKSIIEQNNVFLYPNPSKNAFSLSDLDDVSAIKVFDMYGKTVVSFANIDENLFNVSYLPIGEYVILVSNENGSSSSYKLIKE